MSKILTVFLLIFISAVSTLHLPKYITPCKKSDPNLHKCALENGKKAYSVLVNGDKKYNIQNLAVYRIPLINVDAGPNIKLTFTDFVCTGMKDGILKSIDFDFKKKRYESTMNIEKVNFLGKYDISGRILLLPIEGNGDANVTFVGGSYKYSSDWKLVERNGKEYIEMVNPNLDLDLKRAYFKFDNLFNGDKLLGDEINKLINDNWSEVMQDVGKGIGSTMEAIVTSIYKGYFDLVPFNEIFID